MATAPAEGWGVPFVLTTFAAGRGHSGTASVAVGSVLPSVTRDVQEPGRENLLWSNIRASETIPISKAWITSLAIVQDLLASFTHP